MPGGDSSQGGVCAQLPGVFVMDLLRSGGSEVDLSSLHGLPGISLQPWMTQGQEQC